MFDKI